ncbi:MAG: hypothetical protein R3F21_08950 [Myxococcota bacterium]
MTDGEAGGRCATTVFPVEGRPDEVRVASRIEGPALAVDFVASTLPHVTNRYPALVDGELIRRDSFETCWMSKNPWEMRRMNSSQARSKGLSTTSETGLDGRISGA